MFLPGFIGLADNRDFAKVAGRLCIGRVDEPASYFEYFHADYERAPRYCWDSGIPTSELILARAASWVQQRWGDPKRFDIRWLGAIHAILFLCGWYLLLLALRPLQGLTWWITTAAALWIFADVGIVSYLNTFYTDAAAIAGVMIMLPAALCALSSDVAQRVPVLCFGLGALLFVTSKGQHAAMAPILIAFLLVCRGARVLRIVLAIALLAGASWVLIETPGWYKAQTRFTLIFSKVLTASPARAKDVQELGLSPSDLPLIGQHAFLPYSPAFDRDWLDAFSRRSSFRKIALFWLNHPWRMLATLHADLANEGWKRRPVEFSNFQPGAGRPARAQTSRWSSWSTLTMRLWRWWPMHAVVWYALVLLCGLLLALRSDSHFRRAIAWIAFMAGVLGVGEFLIASLTDARETDRHLLLLHVFTDFTIFMALVYVVDRWSPHHSTS